MNNMETLTENKYGNLPAADLEIKINKTINRIKEAKHLQYSLESAIQQAKDKSTLDQLNKKLKDTVDAIAAAEQAVNEMEEALDLKDMPAEAQNNEDEPDLRDEQESGDPKEVEISSNEQQEEPTVDQTKDNVEDPFSDTPEAGLTLQRKHSKGSANDKPATQRIPTIKELILMINGLKGDAKQGALDGVKDLLAANGAITQPKNKSGVQESYNIIEPFDIVSATDDSFGDFIADGASIINKVSPVTKLSARSPSKVTQVLSDPKLKTALDKEDMFNAQKDYVARKAAEHEAQKYAKYKGLNIFVDDIVDALGSQIDYVIENNPSYSALERKHEDPALIKKGIHKEQIPDTDALPVLDVYFDQSGSWTTSDIKVGEFALGELANMEDSGLLTVNLFYFSNDITTDPNDSCLQKGTHAWEKILSNIQATHATNVVIMTDDDMETEAYYLCKKLVVDGCVWYLWKNGERAEALPKHLQGKQGTKEYSFYN